MKTVYVKLRDFKAAYLGKFKYRVKRNNLNPRKQKVVDRRDKLEAIYEIYKNLSLEDQLKEAINTAYEIGTLDKISFDNAIIQNSSENIFLQEFDLISE